MFAYLRDLEGLHLAAEDGEIGRVTDVYFDDESWTVRYLVVATGSWLFGKKVLISPNAVSSIDWNQSHVNVKLTTEQVRNSPEIDTDRPVSRQQEAEYHLYYNFPPYWGGVALWGRYDQPGAETEPPDTATSEHTLEHACPGNSHLRSSNEVRGYRIMAVDGQVGHIANFLMAVEDWAIRYLIVNTGGYIKKHEVLLTPKLVDRVVWADAVVYVNTSKRLIEDAPVYHTGQQIDRDHETELFEHYTTHPYWN